MTVFGSKRRRVSAVALVGVAVFLAACDPGISPLDPSLGAKWITHDAETVYGVTITNGVTRVAKSSSGGDGRMVFWRLNDPILTDQQSCGTVTAAEQDLQQPGAAVRITGGSTQGTVKAFTVTRNVWGHAYAQINVHLMDTSASNPIVWLGGAVLKGLLVDPNNTTTPHQVKPYPWRMCARAVGQTISLKVWPTSEAEPAWGDPNYSASTTPNYPVWEGQPGLYAGHLENGSTGWLDFTDPAVGEVLSVAGAEGLGPEPTGPEFEPVNLPLAP